ncbi:HPr-rel-A system PqqD family peptide chaperone [Parasphingorhabdus sp.]|uniref:HPr-rel-A system PqqD family peptide chaperone n=1 Tax=Parasphingorhabdus sp. TaxID=2709688 RepID=UPI003A94389F
MSQQYRAAAKNELIWHDLDSMMLLYHRPSGITHMLADPVPAILQVMEDAPLTAGQIASRLMNQFEVEADVDAEEIILARLEELAILGLVCRVSR